MKFSITLMSVLLALPATTVAQDASEMLSGLDLGVPKGRVMACQFNRIVTETPQKKVEEEAENFAVVSSKSTLLCAADGIDDEAEMPCKRFELVGKNDGGSIVFASKDGFKLTTNLLALSLGAGVSVADLGETTRTAFTGQCHDTTAEFVKKMMPNYKE